MSPPDQGDRPGAPVDGVVLFVCVENAARSLMAESMFNRDPPPGWRAISAGTRPAAAPNPRTAGMLREVGLELPPHAPQELTRATIDASSVQITLGCLDDASCPIHLKSLHPVDWGLPDPARLDDAGFRDVRRRLEENVAKLKSELTSRRSVRTS